MNAKALEGKTALVTGGGTGIGLGCARALLRDGATVTIAGRRSDVLEAAAASLAAEAPDGAEVRWLTCDVTVEEDVKRAVGRAADTSGHLDIAVANAGTGFGSYILLTDAATFRQALDLNVIGSYNTIRAAAFAMKDSGGGSIVAMSSVAGALSHRSMPAYCTAKAGLDMLVRCAADELGGFGIRVNSVRPGIVATEIMEAFVIPNQDVVGDYLEKMPIRRVGEIDDVGRLVRFLAGPESSWITGQAIGIDGGLTVRGGPNYDPMMRALLGEDAWKIVRGDE
ncbi:MAG: SDR family oxidoreductase [Deltaproteobacteria bacterium]|nr:SDR family oxidoreductase [Deltaproteobacteria bacterium]